MSIISNSINSTKSMLSGALTTMGKSAVHALAPDNFEYYLCSLELLNAEGDRVGFISFAVMPNNISESTTPIITQTKTRSGIVTLFNDSFAPVSISLQGTFGRKFRLTLDTKNPNDYNNKISNFLNGNIGGVAGIEIGVRTGYGMTRVLKYILQKANEVDNNGRPYILLFRNYSFNSFYVVDVMSYSFNQSIENNMLWFYDIQLKAIAPGDAIKTTVQNMGQILANVAANTIANGLTTLLNSAVSSLGSSLATL